MAKFDSWCWCYKKNQVILNLDQLAADEALFGAQLDDGYRLVVEVDHPQRFRVEAFFAEMRVGGCK